jgi:hypothetical protein
MQVIKINHYNGKQYGYQIQVNGKVKYFIWVDEVELRDKIVWVLQGNKIADFQK